MLSEACGREAGEEHLVSAVRKSLGVEINKLAGEESAGQFYAFSNQLKDALID
ncbi:MAG: hypothetical protein Kow0088_01320 [Anaerolineales bacterium]